MRVVISGPGQGKRRVRISGVLLGDDAVAGGVGGWEADKAGKKRRPVLRFGGTPGWEVTLTLMLGVAEDDKSVEWPCRQLVAWGRRRKGALPPRLKIAGKVRVPTGADWVIDSIEWGPQIRRASDRARVQQQVTVKLIEYNRPPKKPTEKPKKPPRKPKKKP